MGDRGIGVGASWVCVVTSVACLYSKAQRSAGPVAWLESTRVGCHSRAGMNSVRVTAAAAKVASFRAVAAAAAYAAPSVKQAKDRSDIQPDMQTSLRSGVV